MTQRDIPRRSFIKAAAVGAAGLATQPRGALGATLPNRAGPWHLGIASYSLRKFPRATAIEMVKLLGTPYVNLKSFHLPYELSRAELEAARKDVESAGLRIVGGGVITFERDTDDEVRKYFDYAKYAGMPLITATCDPSILPRVERFARQYDIKVALHNHGPGDKFFPSPYDVLNHVRRMDPHMGLCVDVGHTVRTGTDVARAISDAKSRVLDLHLKDLRDLKKEESQCIVGQGAVPVADIFRALDAIDFTGYANLEYEIEPDDPMPGMRESMAYMRGVIAGLTRQRRSASQP